jgi:hypothetical protein
MCLFFLVPESMKPGMPALDADIQKLNLRKRNPNDK